MIEKAIDESNNATIEGSDWWNADPSTTPT